MKITGRNNFTEAFFSIIFFIVLFYQQTFSFQLKYFGLYGEFIRVVTIDTTKPNTLYVGSSSDFSSGETGSLFKTTNGGITWDTLLQVVTVTDFNIHPFNSDIVYTTIGVSAFSPPAVLKSIDGGKNWNKVDSGIVMNWEEGPGVLEIDPLNPENIYVGTAGVFGGNFYKSTNGGNSWSTRGDSTKFYLGVTAITINPDSTNIVYAGTNQSGIVYKSTDYGETWNYTGLSNGLTISITLGKPSSTVYIGTRNGFYFPLGIFQSNDAGSTWENITVGIQDSIFDGRSIIFDQANGKQRVMMCGNNHKYAARIYYKYVEDTMWSLMSLPDTLPQIHQLKLFNGKILFGTPRGLYIVDKPTNVVNNSEHIIPESFTLYQNYPNPFNPATTISYALPKTRYVTLNVYDVLGREVGILVNESKDAGLYSVQWNASQFSSGIYFATLRAGSFSTTKKLLLMK